MADTTTDTRTFQDIEDYLRTKDREAVFVSYQDCEWWRNLVLNDLDARLLVLHCLRAQSTNYLVSPAQRGDGLWRVRTGDFRIVYTVKDERLLIIVITVRNHKDVYDKLKRAGLID